VTVVFVLAWAIAPIKAGTEREWWQWTIVSFLALLSVSQVVTLLWRSRRGWRRVNEAWQDILDAESTGRDGGSLVGRGLMTFVWLLLAASAIRRRRPLDIQKYG
jgi:hypothetical protein